MLPLEAVTQLAAVIVFCIAVGSTSLLSGLMLTAVLVTGELKLEYAAPVGE